MSKMITIFDTNSQHINRVIEVGPCGTKVIMFDKHKQKFEAETGDLVYVRARVGNLLFSDISIMVEDRDKKGYGFPMGIAKTNAIEEISIIEKHQQFSETLFVSLGDEIKICIEEDDEKQVS